MEKITRCYRYAIVPRAKAGDRGWSKPYEQPR
jgi:hypothetical protein